MLKPTRWMLAIFAVYLMISQYHNAREGIIALLSDARALAAP